MVFHVLGKTVREVADREQLKKKLPVRFDEFYTVLQKCARLLVDTGLPAVDSPDCYAVLSVEYAIFAYTFFLIATSAAYRTRSLRIVEEEKHVVLVLDLVPREQGEAPRTVVADETARALFLRYAAQTDLTFAATPGADGVTVRLSFVRFRAQEYTSAGVTSEVVGDLILEAMQQNAQKREEK